MIPVDRSSLLGRGPARPAWANAAACIDCSAATSADDRGPRWPAAPGGTIADWLRPGAEPGVSEWCRRSVVGRSASPALRPVRGALAVDMVGRARCDEVVRAVVDAMRDGDRARLARSDVELERAGIATAQPQQTSV